MIDSHCHLQLCREPIPDILERAAKAGLTDLVQVATDVATAQFGLQLKSQSNPIAIHPTAGLYPSRAAEDWEAELPVLKELLFSGEVCALGEVGIDMYHDTTYLDRQERMLRAQIELALEADLPMIFHIRQSYQEVVAVLSEYRSDPRLRGVWHCFEGTLEQAQQFVEWGWMISFSGLYTYKNNQVLRDVAKVLPLEHLLIETDSPYLSPEPLRRERNEPAKVAYVLERMAQELQMDQDELDKITSDNTRRLFRLSSPT